MKEIEPICEWCGKPIKLGESSQVVYGEPMHTVCANEEEEDAFFSRDMGFD